MRRAALLAAALGLAACGKVSGEDARMLLAGADAAAQTKGIPRLQILAVTCGRIVACARGCRPVFEGFADEASADRFALLRRCPDVQPAVPAGDEAQMASAAQAFFLGRLRELEDGAARQLTAAEGARLRCELAALRLGAAAACP